MKSFKSSFLSLFVIMAASMCNDGLLAQSTDPDKPTVLRDGEFNVSIPDNKTKYYYTFDLLEGEIVLTADVSGGNIKFDLVDEDFKTINYISDNWYKGVPSKRNVTRRDSHRKQKAIMILSANHGNGATLELRIEGAAKFNGGAVVVQKPNSPEQSNTAGGQKIVVTLKDGTTLEGRFTSSSFSRNAVKNKLTFSVQGKSVPDFNMNDVASVTIVRE